MTEAPGKQEEQRSEEEEEEEEEGLSGLVGAGF